MTRAAQIEPWASVADVARELGCARTKATEIVKLHLGGFKPAGLDAWRCTWRAIREYKRKQEQGAACHDYRSSHGAPKAEPTGIATSEHQTDADSSERCTSETMAPETPSAPPLRPTGTSKHEQRMASLIAKSAHAKRSEKRSKRSHVHKS